MSFTPSPQSTNNKSFWRPSFRAVNDTGTDKLNKNLTTKHTGPGIRKTMQKRKVAGPCRPVLCVCL